MQIKYYNNQNIFQKYKELEKNYIKLKKQIEGNNQKQNYKTELCKKFQTKGYCPYGSKCRFAHGKEELNSKNTGNNYKKKSCKTFLENGFCPYGSRCSFKHDERTLNDIKLPYYYIKTFIYNNFNCNYRLNIFEEITSSNINNNNECFKNKDFNDINSSSTSTISIESEDNNF